MAATTPSGPPAAARPGAHPPADRPIGGGLDVARHRSAPAAGRVPGAHRRAVRPGRGHGPHGVVADGQRRRGAHRRRRLVLAERRAWSSARPASGAGRAAATVEWSGRWRMAVVTGGARPADERAELRRAMVRAPHGRAARRRLAAPRQPGPRPTRPAAVGVVDAASASGSWRIPQLTLDRDDATLAAELWDLDRLGGPGAAACGARCTSCRSDWSTATPTALAPGFVAVRRRAAPLRGRPAAAPRAAGRAGGPGMRCAPTTTRYDTRVPRRAGPLERGRLVTMPPLRWRRDERRRDADRPDAERPPAADESAGERPTGPPAGRGPLLLPAAARRTGLRHRRDPVARQMVNFVYLIGDRQTGECVVVDPAYGVARARGDRRRRTA